MTTAEIEDRLTAVERELALLKAQISIPVTSPNHWIEKIAGKYSSPDDQKAFDEAMEYGRQWRKAQGPRLRKRRKISKR